MLGKPSHRLQKRLEESGRRATATVVEIASKGMAVTTGGGQLVSDTEVMLKTRLRVEPEGEPAFEVEQRMRWPQMGVPIAGMTLPVIYDPDDHDKLIVDSDPTAMLDSKLVGTSLPPGGADMIHNVLDAARHGGNMADMQNMARQWAQQAYGGAPATGGMPVIGGMAMPGVTPPAPVPEDPVDRLAKLADLRDRGIVTDAEFNEQKARILGET